MSKTKILIVEDEILIADNIKRYLELNEYIVLDIAISYEEAKEIFIKEKPDIVLLDIRLYGPKSGIDFAHFIQRQSEIKPFIFLTSQMDAENIKLAKQTFPDGYLSKPIQKDSLVASIEIAIHKHSIQPIVQPTLAVYDGTNHYLIPYKDILYLKAEHVYVQIHLDSEKYILQRGALKDLLAKLPSKLFYQTHRSYAINVNKVTHWDAHQVFIQKTSIP